MSYLYFEKIKRAGPQRGGGATRATVLRVAGGDWGRQIILQYQAGAGRQAQLACTKTPSAERTSPARGIRRELLQTRRGLAAFLIHQGHAALSCVDFLELLTNILLEVLFATNMCFQMAEFRMGCFLIQFQDISAESELRGGQTDRHV